MRQSIITLAVLASYVSAQSTISFFFPGGADGVDPVATIKTAISSTTEFLIACPTGVDSNDCGWGPGMDYTIMSGTRYQGVITASEASETMKYSFGCDYNSKVAEATCTVDDGAGNLETNGTPITSVLNGTDVHFLTATIVKGASLLSGGASATTTAKNTAASASSGLITATGSQPVASQTSGSGSKTAAGGSAVATASTGAAVKYGIEGSALLALVGAAAVNVWQ